MRRTTWLLAAVLSPLLMAGCTTPTIDGGPRAATVDCTRSGTVRYPEQVCRVLLVWDDMRQQFKLPAELKTIYLEDPAPARVIWRLPARPVGHFFERDSLELGHGNGYFSDADTGDESDESQRGAARSKVYRVVVTQVPNLRRQYELKVTIERPGLPVSTYKIDPTIANGNSFVTYSGSPTTNLSGSR